jgi:hypothetical protein
VADFGCRIKRVKRLILSFLQNVCFSFKFLFHVNVTVVLSFVVADLQENKPKPSNMQFEHYFFLVVTVYEK